MHVYTDSPHSIGAGRRGGAMQSGEHISDWFIQLIDKYPDILIRILHFYIECVVSNPVKAVSILRIPYSSKPNSYFISVEDQ